MIRLLNIAAIAALVASAIYAYSIKYQTILRAETVTRLRLEIKTEQDAIGILRADWANLTRPERVQALTDKLLPLQPLKLDQIVHLDALPDKAQQQHGDAIAQKLEDLGLSEPTATPSDAVTGSVPSTATPATPAAGPSKASTSAAGTSQNKGAAAKTSSDKATLAKAAR